MMNVWFQHLSMGVGLLWYVIVLYGFGESRFGLILVKRIMKTKKNNIAFCKDIICCLDYAYLKIKHLSTRQGSKKLLLIMFELTERVKKENYDITGSVT